VGNGAKVMVLNQWFQNPLKCRTCLVMKNSDQILHGYKKKRTWMDKSKKVITACKITD
jgi:hypothetical protein